MHSPMSATQPAAAEVSGALDNHRVGSVLVINAGSSSLKFAAFGVDTAATDQLPQRLLHGAIEGLGGAAPKLQAWAREGGAMEERTLDAGADPDRAHAAALAALLQWLGRHHADTASLGNWLAVAHRIVHGGEHFKTATRLTPEVMVQLEALQSLAPLHQPHNLAAIRALEVLLPGVLQIVGFDTAFHTSQHWVAQAYALPQVISQAGVKRYGFHGLSCEYIAGQLPAHLGAEQAEGRVVIAHLGNGASLCAMQNRRSVASTMGLTVLDGLVMGTRCGHLDPGVVLHLMQQMAMTPAQVETLLYQHSGLLGVSGLSSDMRTLQASNDPAARAAIELFAWRLRCELGAMAAALGGLDALVFTAGIGEHSAEVRRRVCTDAAWLGIELDEAANAAGGPCISRPGSRCSAWVLPTNEEWMLARHAQRLLQA